MGFLRECMGFFKAVKNRIKLTATGKDFLCDSCKYNYDRACRHPRRPNVRSCDDYKRK